MAFKTAKQLTKGDQIIFSVSGRLIESTVKTVELVEFDRRLITLESGDAISREPVTAFQRAVINLVPKEKKGGIGKRLDYEVLAYFTEHEYDISETEADIKKHIIAKFKDYDDALAYARSKAIQPVYSHVIVRA